MSLFEETELALLVTRTNHESNVMSIRNNNSLFDIIGHVFFFKFSEILLNLIENYSTLPVSLKSCEAKKTLQGKYFPST